MAYICKRDCKCSECPHYRYDEDYGSKACFGKQDETKENKAMEDFNYYWIAKHNAMVMKKGIEENKAPFLPDKNGDIRTEIIYNAASGYPLPLMRLLPCQFAKMENGYKSNIVTPILTPMGRVKDNERGVYYRFKDEMGDYHCSQLFFKEQLLNETELDNVKLNEGVKGLEKVSFVIASSSPVEYLGSYIASCRAGMMLSVSPEIAEDFKHRIMPYIDSEIKGDTDKDPLTLLLFQAEKRGTEICRSLLSQV